MSAADLTQFLIDVTRGPRQAEFAADAQRTIDTAPLDAPLREALRAQDMGALWKAGAHPMALLYFARACGWDNPRYYRALQDAQLSPGAPGPAAAP